MSAGRELWQVQQQYNSPFPSPRLGSGQATSFRLHMKLPNSLFKLRRTNRRTSRTRGLTVIFNTPIAAWSLLITVSPDKINYLFVWGYGMPFLDPTVQFDPEVKQYRSALEKFSRLLEEGDLGTLPVPTGVCDPIWFVQVSRASRDDETEVVGSVRDHVINLLAGDPFREPELRYNFNMLLLLDVFGLQISECGKYEEGLEKKLWAPDLDLGLE